ncbi:MAG TPA: CHASE3 domain-containing protein [Cytophagaceae bacterium]|jgi:signal transduction histidine kinase/DNA-binding response OmpR family regulator|nr:CHASE3 domain-containing protein [Cytophagaceae bacterium]
MNWQLNKKITTGFAIAILVILIVGLVAHQTINNFRATNEREIRVRKTLEQLEDVFSTVKDVETGQRGFIITGKESYVEPYNNAKATIQTELKELRELINDDVQHKNLDSLEKLISTKLILSNRLIEVRKSDGFGAALKIVLTDESKILMDSIRTLTSKMINHEDKLFQEKYDAEVSTGKNAVNIIILGNAIALVFLLTALIILNIDIKLRIKTEEQLKIAKEEAEEANKTEEQFLANMSHEIRTPMNAVVGMTNLILQSDLTPKQLEYMKAIKQSSDNLLIIINDILDFSKIRAGKIETESIDFRLGEILQGLYNTFRFKTEEKNLKFINKIDPALPDVIIGDPVRLNQILINLIGNAIKFTETGSITIESSQIKRDAELVTIQFSVKDTGIGIKEEKLDTIFESFSQASSDTTRKYGGTGLGLTISKQLIELQGGEISVHSKINEGTTFSFILPFSIGSQENIQEFKIKEINTNNLNGLRVLLVDDNDLNQIVAVDTLNLLIKNLKIDIAQNGRVALEKVENANYDIILMDVHMPELDGYETTKRIRNKKNSYHEIPIMAMTASATIEEVQKCLKSGMDDCIAKPFDPAVLLRKISALITREIVEQEESIIIIDQTPIKHVPKDINKEETPSKDHVDLSFLKKITGNDDANTLKYINLMLESIPKDLVNLNNYYSEKDWAGLKGTAHSMKPKINYIGLKEGLEIITNIENYAENQVNLDSLPKLLSKFNNILQIALKELENEKEYNKNL